MRTTYRIDDYQQIYFVIDSFNDLLRQLSSLCGQVSYRERRSKDRIITWHDVMTVAMFRQLPPQFMVITMAAACTLRVEESRAVTGDVQPNLGHGHDNGRG